MGLIPTPPKMPSFEGHIGKEPNSGMFHPKAGVVAADGKAVLPPGHAPHVAAPRVRPAPKIPVPKMGG